MSDKMLLICWGMIRLKHDDKSKHFATTEETVDSYN